MADEPLSLALKRGHMDCAELLVSYHNQLNEASSAASFNSQLIMRISLIDFPPLMSFHSLRMEPTPMPVISWAQKLI